MQLSNPGKTIAIHPNDVRPEDNIRTLSVRLSEQTIQKLTDQMQRCGLSFLTEVIRQRLEHRKVNIKKETYNLDACMWLLSDIRQSLELFTLNRAEVQRLLKHTDAGPFNNERIKMKITEMKDQTHQNYNLPSNLQKMHESLFDIISKLSYIWLSK